MCFCFIRLGWLNAIGFASLKIAVNAILEVFTQFIKCLTFVSNDTHKS